MTPLCWRENGDGSVSAQPRIPLGEDVSSHCVTVVPGDGVGPEVVSAAREVLEASGAPLEWEVCGITSGTTADSPFGLEQLVESARRNRVVLKGPLSATRNGPIRSPNIALRRALDLQVQVRPVRSFVLAGSHDRPVDFVLVRVMTEDVNDGVEYAAGTDRGYELVDWIARDGVQVDRESGFSIKTTSAAAARRGLELGFAWAHDHRRRRATIVHKATIMRATDALFLDVARAVGSEGGGLDVDALLIDDAAMQLVLRPSDFDVIVTSNLYGDILSGVAAGIVGSVGLVPGATFGDEVAVFEAAHGSAPKYAGQDRANPVAMILSGAMLLSHLGTDAAAARIEKAVAEVLAEGHVLTQDLARRRRDARTVGTRGLAEAIKERL